LLSRKFIWIFNDFFIYNRVFHGYPTHYAIPSGPGGVPVIFHQMTCFFAAKTSPNMIGLTVKNIKIKKQLKKKFKVPGDLFCTIFD
jgi:hypothetical protein